MAIAYAGSSQVLIYALLDAATDKDPSVNLAVTNALQKLGDQKPELMLHICYHYLKQPGKLSQEHRTVVLTAMAAVCQNGDLQSTEIVFIKDVINFCIEEMISSKEVIPFWQGAACSVLIALGRQFCYDVMGCLHVKFHPGAVPHYFIVQTLGDLASANPFGMIPFMKTILQTTLTMIGIVKHDNMKWVFSRVLGQFSEAISDYLNNIEKAPDHSVKKEVFLTELSVAFSTLSSHWIYSKEPELKMAVVVAIGSISQLLTKETLDNELSRIIPIILAMYKRHTQAYLITQSLTKIMESAIKNYCTTFTSQLDSILFCLFPQISTLPDYNDYDSTHIKNHNEILRCFTIVASCHSDCIISFVLERLDSNNENVKIGCLTILRHLINSSDSFISDQIATIITGLYHFLNETNIKVKKVFAHVIVALAHHGFLELDSTQAMIEFIIKQCALPYEETSTDNGSVGNNDLRTMCENILHLLTTTVEKMGKILWPHILKFLIPEHLTNAVGVLSKNAEYLSRKLTSDDLYGAEVDFKVHENLPSSVQLLSRMFILLGHPNAGNSRGIHLLSLMRAIVPCLETKMTSFWDVEIPKLLLVLEDAALFSQKKWEMLVIELLSNSIQEVDSQDWTVDLGKTLVEQMSLYSQHYDEKNFSFRCVGIVLMKINSKQVVNDLMDLIFKQVNHSLASDREGFAAALGYCSSTHMDSVLVKLDDLAREEIGKKSKLFSFIKDIKGETEHGNWKATLILSYGYAVMGADPLLLKDRIESPIMRNIMPYFCYSKEPTVRLSLIQATELIAKSVRLMHVKEKFAFRYKQQMLKHMQSFISAEKGVLLTSMMCSNAIDTCTELLKLDPVLSQPDQLLLLQTCYECILQMPEIDTRIRHEYGEDHKRYQLSAFSSLAFLLQELLLQDVSPNNLYYLFLLLVWIYLRLNTLNQNANSTSRPDESNSLLFTFTQDVGILFISLEPIIRSSVCCERERAMHIIWIITKAFLDNLPVILVGSYSFDSYGTMLARLVPRFTDPSAIVRGLALESIHAILKAVSKCNGIYSDDTDQEGQMFSIFKDKLKQGDPKSLFSVTTELAKVLSAKLLPSQLRLFLDVLMEGLTDSEGSCSSGTCVVLNNVLKLKGSSLHQEMDTLIHLLHGKLCEITCMQTRKGTLQVIKSLARFHMSSVLNSLLSYPLPYDRHVSDWWKTLASDSYLCSSMTEQFCEVLMCVAPYTEHPDPRNKKDVIRVATSKSLAIVGAFREIFLVCEVEKPNKQMFERIFTCLLTIVTCYTNAHFPNVVRDVPKNTDETKPIILRGIALHFSPCSLAIDSLKTFLLYMKYDIILEDAGDLFEPFDDLDSHLNAVAVLVMSLAKNYQQHVPGLVSLFNQKLSRVYDSERIVSVAFFAELIKHRNVLNHMMLEIILNSLLGRLVDTSRVVRRLAINGLSSVGKLDAEHMDTLEWFGVYKYSNTILSAMVSGLDDKDDPDGQISLEAMKGLIKVLENLEESHLENALNNIALRVQPYFEKDNAKMREVAFCLLGKLSRFSKGLFRNAFLEQLHNNLVCLLLHLNDENTDVVMACKEALRSLGPSLSSPMANNMLQVHLIDDCKLLFRDFIANFSKILVADFPHKVPFYVATCTTYFKSPWPSIKGNAALFAGYLLLNSPKGLYTASKNHAVFSGISALLKDSSPEVKIKAADAISLLYQF